MSIYRRIDRVPSNDTYAHQVKGQTGTLATSSHGALPKEDCKAAPASQPLPRTLEWLASLPADVQPTALLRDYARIANVIAAVWRDPKSLRSYMDCLITDDRGSRRGFPPDVLLELAALRQYYDSLHAENSSAWTFGRERG
jgi:hypothetical protein